MSNLKLEPKWVLELVKNAYIEANKNNGGKPDYTSEGSCLNAVENILEKTLNIKAKRPNSAYEFPNCYNRYTDFLKFYSLVDNSNPLYSLPIGSIIVWDKELKHKHGHIEIKTKNPCEFTSDYIQISRVTYGLQEKPYKIYVPK